MPEPRADWHTLAPDDALGALGSGPDGLSPQEAGRRLEAHGWNVLPRGPVEGPLALLWRQVNNPLIWVLLGSAALAFVMKKTIDGAVVLGVVVLNALIGFVQEWKAGKALAALEQMVPDLTTVVRGGARLTVPAAELVPGDLVALASGDKVPADLRLVAVRNLQVNESALTGESVPVAKDTVPLPLATELGDRRNMAFSGTLVTAGTAQGAVAGTGAATELGRISALLAQTKEVETPLTQALDKVGSALTVAIVAVSAAIFGLALWRGYPLIDATLAAITLAVAAIPEGLPAIITITLAIGVQRMANRKAVVRKLPAVETLGSTTVICSDKTGTLTRNEMTVTRLLAASGLYELTGVGYAPAGRLKRDGRGVDRAPEDVVELLEAAVLVSDAVLRRERESWLLEGDPTEGALVAAAGKVGIDPQGLRARCPRRDAIPFESENLYMASEHDVPGAPSPVVYLKGAPEVVLARCEARRGGAPLLADEALETAEDLARDGMRVLAVAAKPGTPEEAPLAPADVAAGFSFLGLLAMIDPPRQEAVDAVATCHRAGVTVKMITGDHRATAAAIGRQLGILQEDEAVTGAQLSAMSEAELAAAASRVNVFARVAPEHKLKLVRALQAKGEVVAMTGDGVNDAPALKQANIGVAMGITGTAVSKEAADLVLTDDDFASIEAAVEEGRRIWDNLVKSLAFVLPTNIGEALLILVAVAFFPIHDGQPLLPVLPVQILWINLVATVTLALPLAFEAKEPDVMTRPPRQPGTPIMGPFVWFRTVLVAVLMAAAGIALFVQEYARGTASGLLASQALREAQTMTVTSVACLQIFYLLTCRSLKGSVLRIGLFSNATVWVGIVALVLLQAAFVYLPAFHTLFGSAPLDAVEWLKSALAGAVVLPVVLVEKWVRRWLERRG